MTAAVSISLTGPARRAMSAAERRAAHLVALAAPMVGVPFRGAPTVIGAAKTPSPGEWERCRYATAILRRRDPSFGGDLSHLRASLDLFDTVVFRAEVRCRKTAAHPDGLTWIVVATVQLARDGATSPTLDLRSGDRGPAPQLPAPSPAPASTAVRTERTAP